MFVRFWRATTLGGVVLAVVATYAQDVGAQPANTSSLEARNVAVGFTAAGLAHFVGGSIALANGLVYKGPRGDGPGAEGVLKIGAYATYGVGFLLTLSGGLVWGIHQSRVNDGPLADAFDQQAIGVGLTASGMAHLAIGAGLASLFSGEAGASVAGAVNLGLGAALLAGGIPTWVLGSKAIDAAPGIALTVVPSAGGVGLGGSF